VPEPENWLRHIPTFRRRIYIWQDGKRVGKMEWVT
jgi:hypothetical protein